MTQSSIGQSFDDPDKPNDAEFKSEHTSAPEPPTKRWSPSDQIISLEEAVAQIKSAHQAYAAIRTQRSSSTRRFFFMIGAGISYPPIPLASGIVAACREIILKSNHKRLQTLDQQLSKKAPIEQYETYFRSAFPSPFQRADYLRSLIGHAKISHANLRLAHLLSATTDTLISELVVTTNFDELLFKSLRLFGKEPQVFSHPAEFYRIPLDEDEPLVVHLHGRVHNYDVANLIFEQERTAKSCGVQSFLDHLLAERSPLVVGYSGWENDAFMWNLNLRLQNDPALKANLYWFCYSRQAYDQLPRWLRHCKQVFFVVPGSSQNTISREKLHLGLEPKLGAPGFEYDIAETRTLPATQVFEQLIRAFSIDPPKFTSRPLDFVAERLEHILPDNPSPDNDSIRFEARNYFLRRIWRMIAKLAEEENNRGGQCVSAVLDKVRRSEFGAALDLAVQVWNAIEDKNMATEERTHELYDLQDATWTATLGLDSTEGELDWEKELKGHEIVCDICGYLLDSASKYLRQEELDYIKNRRVRSLLYKGIKLAYRNRDWKGAYEAFKGAVMIEGQELDDNPGIGLRLWRNANLTCVVCQDTTVITDDALQKDACINELLEESRRILEKAKDRIGRSPELEYAFVQAAFNKACLEKKLDRQEFTESLEYILGICSPKHGDSISIINQAQVWREQSKVPR